MAPHEFPVATGQPLATGAAADMMFLVAWIPAHDG